MESPNSESAELTQLLRAWGAGEQSVLDRLTPLIYAELKRLARHYLRGEQSDNSLQTTALVHEGWLRIAKSN